VSNSFIHVIVLAAGEASRFGAPKQLADLNGRSLLQVNADLVSELSSELSSELKTELHAHVTNQGFDLRSVVVLGAHQDTIASSADLSVWDEVLICPEWHQGMQSTIYHAFTALDLPSSCLGGLILLADQPLVNAQDLAELLHVGLDAQVIACSDYAYAREAADQHGALTDRPSANKESVGVPVFFPVNEIKAYCDWYKVRKHAQEGGELSTSLGAKKFIMQRDYRSLKVRGIGFDIDTPEDLKRIENYCLSRSS